MHITRYQLFLLLLISLASQFARGTEDGSEGNLVCLWMVSWCEDLCTCPVWDEADKTRFRATCTKPESEKSQGEEDQEEDEQDEDEQDQNGDEGDNGEDEGENEGDENENEMNKKIEFNIKPDRNIELCNDFCSCGPPKTDQTDSNARI